MSKIIKSGKDAQEQIIRGVDAVADIVKTTLGPKGRNILIRELGSRPTITNDGVTIAKAIKLKDNAEDAGAQLLISAAEKTNVVAGDGTSSTTVLAQEMIHQFYKCVDAGGIDNPVQVQKEMIKAGDEISKKLLDMATPVNSTESLERVASISSGSPELGKLIADAFDKAGEYGTVIVEESKTGVNNLVEVDGMRITNGSVSPYLFNDRMNLKTDMSDVNVLITLDKIDSVADLFHVLDTVINAGKKLLIMCDDIEFEPLNMVIMNKMKGVLSNIAIIRLPGFGTLREQLIDDISIATGAHVLSREFNGLTLKDFTIDMLGYLDSVTVTSNDSILKFADIEELKNARNARITELKDLISSSDEDVTQYERRIANLSSGIITIQIGGNSEAEMTDTKLRIEDAINSVKAAKEEGIVPGGGYSFLTIFKNFEREVVHPIGEEIVYYSLPIITKQIAENAGFNGTDIVDQCLQTSTGFNALTGEFENLLESGVINSVKVDRYSIINAISIASTIITSGGLIVEENEPDSNVFQLQAPATMGLKL